MNNRVLGDLITRVRRPIAVEPAKRYAEIGVRSHGKGIFHKESVTGAELGTKKVFEIDLVISYST
jgi:type I restriction enzyme, S subunit